MATKIWGNKIKRWGLSVSKGSSDASLKTVVVDTTEYPTLASFLASNGESGVIYLYPNGETGSDNEYFEYVWVEDKAKFELLDSVNIDISGKADKEVTPTVITPSVDGSVINLTAEEIENFRVGDIVKDHNSLDGSYKDFFVVSNKATEVILVYIDQKMLFPCIFTKNGSSWSYDMTQSITFSDLARKTAVATSQPQGGMRPNVFYNLGVILSNITFSLFSSTDNTHLNMYMWSFETRDTVPTITWPAQITMWSNGEAQEIEANKYYEVSVMNGVGTLISADLPQTNVKP